MDSLKPADMPAVLERTNLPPNVENFLLPIYEALSNAIYATEARWQNEAAEKGRISLDISTINFTAIIADNGFGLNADNYNHFRTPFTSFRLKKGGKGFGRFIAFKVFETVSYRSAFLEDGAKSFRAFDFDIYADEEFKDPSVSLEFKNEEGCAVLYKNPRENFRVISEKLEGLEIVERVIRYFLPFFLSGKLPEFKITVDGAEFDARSHFTEFFTPQVSLTKEILINGDTHSFIINISKVKRERLFNEHVMLLFADGRIIGSGRKIEGKIGKPYFENSQSEKQIYVATVSSEFLDKRANTARTQIETDEDEIDAIVEVVAENILNLEKDFVKEHRESQVKNVQNAIIRNPLLRTALNGMDIEKYVASKPMSWKAEAFVGDLALQRYRGQTNWEASFREGLSTPEKLKEMSAEIFKHIDIENKDALASYVSHRKSVIQLTEKMFEFQKDGKMGMEDMFHDLVYPRHEDSETTEFYRHNLWLIDEKLSFFTYCSSDRTLHGGRRQKGDKIADLVFFDDCSIYRENDQDTLVLVEFKRPGRDDYKFGDSSKDPVQQVIETAVKIREERRIITKTGRTIDVPDGVRLSAYIIADIEPSLTAICDSHDMGRTWDNRGYYTYHEKKDVFIEVASYDKILEDAKKRNAAFFDILLGDIVN